MESKMIFVVVVVGKRHYFSKLFLSQRIHPSNPNCYKQTTTATKRKNIFFLEFQKHLSNFNESIATKKRTFKKK